MTERLDENMHTVHQQKKAVEHAIDHKLRSGKAVKCVCGTVISVSADCCPKCYERPPVAV